MASISEPTLPSGICNCCQIIAFQPAQNCCTNGCEPGVRADCAQTATVLQRRGSASISQTSTCRFCGIVRRRSARGWRNPRRLKKRRGLRIPCALSQRRQRSVGGPDVLGRLQFACRLWSERRARHDERIGCTAFAARRETDISTSGAPPGRWR
jgi:hypothetical protein